MNEECTGTDSDAVVEAVQRDAKCPRGVAAGSSHHGSIERLDNGAYFASRRDPTTGGRTVEIIGPAGQLCATLALDAASDCALRDHLFADGTLALEVQTTSCSLTWWPRLGHAR